MAIDMKRAFAALGMPPAKYALVFGLPLALTGVVVVLLLRFIIPYAFEGIVGPILWMIPLFFVVLAFFYPFTVAEGKKSQIDNNIHFFITHMGVLATANIPRAQILKLLGNKLEYGALAEESRKIFTLVDAWNMSLPEACRFVAKRTPSEIFADFLDRFAYALESGEELELFLKNEQLVVMNDYATLYKGKLYEVENMKSMFSSMVMAVIFVVLFAILVPVITGLDATWLIVGAIAFVAFIEISFVFFTRAKAPNDPIWHELKLETRLSKALLRSLPVSVALCFVVLFALLLLPRFGGPEIPVPFVLAGGLTPLIVSGLVISREEDRVKRRDDNYAAFIRSLGASTSARGGQVTEVLRHLRHHDFGALTENIRDLYARLNMRVDDDKAWAHFSADCGSNLIEKFSRMFLEGMQAGGKPDIIGRIISDNFIIISSLRKARYQAASSFRGMLYGLVVGMALALFVGVSILNMLQTIAAEVSLEGGADSPLAGFFSFSANIPLLGYLMVIMLLLHSASSALMVKVADGGNYFRSWVDLVGMFWLAVVVSHMASKGLTGLFAQEFTGT